MPHMKRRDILLYHRTEAPSDHFIPESEPEPVDHESILIGNLAHLPYLDGIDLHSTTFVAHGNQLLLVTFDYWENQLETRLFSLAFDQSQILPVADFGEERIRNVESIGDILIVITDRAVYHFDSNLNLMEEVEFPQLFVSRDFSPLSLSGKRSHLFFRLIDALNFDLSLDAFLGLSA